MPRAESLRWRLLCSLAVLLVVLMLASGLSAYWNGREAADTAYDRTLLASARTLAARLSPHEASLSVEVPWLALDTFAYDSAGRIYYQINDIQGRPVSGYEDLPPPPADAPRTDDYPALARFYSARYRGQDVRVVSLLKAISDPQMNGMVEIRVAETDEARVRMARSLMSDTLFRLGLLGVGALLLVWHMVSAALRPLERLRMAVEARQPDDLRPLPAIDVQQELRPLARALDHFTARLRQQFKRQAQFVAEAAHELRTPLAALKARLELGLRAPAPEEWRLALQAAAHSTDRLVGLANQLLSLARIENGARAMTDGGAQPVDLAQLARELGLSMAALAHGRGVALALEAEQPVWLRGDPTLLYELLSNLVDNALAHTPSGGSVILRVSWPAVLEVEDDGPGIPTEERERVFERFYRCGTQGTGLGLAIVGEICRAHRAQVSLHEGGKGGLRVRVAFTAV
ncbi:sensor histidine kinase [Pseudomonas sp. dw_358]|uniref:sensor histidine kinase n=1 Tax=Pseudomonas sp. dw_358 TaxID=2720083 RepID=UPI001BD4BEAF|nr:sensor histidine kinase [Pseudomonas sp. dw_358]